MPRHLSEVDKAWADIQWDARLKRLCDAKNHAVADGTYCLPKHYRDTPRSVPQQSPNFHILDRATYP